MSLRITEHEWKEAEQFFRENADQSIYHRKISKLNHTFIKFDHEMVALARKHHPKEGILGEGGEATVKEAINRTGKIFTLKSDRGAELLPEESPLLQILKKLGLFFGQTSKKLNKPKTYISLHRINGELKETHLTIDKKRYTLLEKAEGIDLFELFNTDLSNFEILRVALQSAVALAQLHQKRIIHNDVTPMNIIIDVENDWSVKFIDYNFSLDLPPGQKNVAFKTARGNPDFVAPEIHGRIYSFESDIYSLGKVFRFIGIPEELCNAMEEARPGDRLRLHRVIFYLVSFIKKFDLDIRKQTMVDNAIALAKNCLQQELEGGVFLPDLMTPYIFKEITEQEKQIILHTCLHVVNLHHMQRKIFLDILPQHFLVTNKKKELAIKTYSAVKELPLNKQFLSLPRNNDSRNRHYIAPESIRAGKYSAASNVYSLGQIVKDFGYDPGKMIEDEPENRPALETAIKELLAQFEERNKPKVEPKPVLHSHKIHREKERARAEAYYADDEYSCSLSTDSHSTDELESVVERIKDFKL